MNMKPSSNFENILRQEAQQLRRRYHKPKPSKLDAYKNKILILRQCHLSFRKIAYWLNEHHDISVSTSTIKRRCDYWEKLEK
jgi:hypothetical protein